MERLVLLLCLALPACTSATINLTLYVIYRRNKFRSSGCMDISGYGAHDHRRFFLGVTSACLSTIAAAACRCRELLHRSPAEDGELIRLLTVVQIASSALMIVGVAFKTSTHEALHLTFVILSWLLQAGSSSLDSMVAAFAIAWMMRCTVVIFLFMLLIYVIFWCYGTDASRSIASYVEWAAVIWLYNALCIAWLWQSLSWLLK